MYIIWLIFMALVIGYLAVPLSRRLGYSYGLYGRFTDILIILAGTLAFGILVVATLSALGFWTGDTLIALTIASLGALIMVGFLTLLSAKSASEEDHLIN